MIFVFVNKFKYHSNYGQISRNSNCSYCRSKTINSSAPDRQNPNGLFVQVDQASNTVQACLQPEKGQPQAVQLLAVTGIKEGNFICEVTGYDNIKWVEIPASVVYESFYLAEKNNVVAALNLVSPKAAQVAKIYIEQLVNPDLQSNIDDAVINEALPAAGVVSAEAVRSFIQIQLSKNEH